MVESIVLVVHPNWKPWLDGWFAITIQQQKQDDHVLDKLHDAYEAVHLDKKKPSDLDTDTHPHCDRLAFQAQQPHCLLPRF